MAIRKEKTATGTDIVIDGWETGIAPSPHKGIANIQNGNISTETGEITASFVRQQQTIQSSATGTGTLTFADSSHVNLDISGSNDYFKGNWITVTNSSNTGELPNGTYYVPPSTGSTFQLANYYNVSATAGAAQNAQVLVVAGGGGGGTYTGSGGNSGAGGGGAGEYNYSAAVSFTSRSLTQISVGAGGTGGDSTNSYQGYSGSSSSCGSITSLGGGGGGATSSVGNRAGANGGSGGGAGNSGSGTTTGGTATATAGGGHNGGNAVAVTAGAGGGGATAAGANATVAATGTAGGAGTANSISGSSVTYAGGGGGGASTTGGAGGAGGGGAGGSGNANGTAATANTGGGGGGAGGSGTGGGTGGAGGSGIVIISFPTGVVTNPTTAGGTHTTSGGRDIFTFSTVGSFTFYPIFADTPAPDATLSGFTAGLTATIQLVHVMGKPIAKATETYFHSGGTYYRYYILDNQNLVWVYDSYNETLYSPSDNVNWFLPDYKTDWCTSATGIAVLDGFLLAAAQDGMYGKAVVNLGGTNTQNTTWTAFGTQIPWNGGSSTSPHFCYVGHQGRIYITDGNYIRSYFPDSTLITSVTGVTGDNVQSLASWTPNTSRNLNGFYVYATASPISCGQPFTSDEKALPVVFFTNGALPSSITANQVYYLTRSGSDFVVTPDPSIASSGSSVTMTSMPTAGATTATLTANWAYPTGYYIAEFTYSGGTEAYNVLFTNGSTTIVWNTPLVHNTTSTTLHFEAIIDISTGAVGTQYYATFYPITSATAPYETGTVGTALSTVSTQRLTLPGFEVSQCMAEIGNIMLIGCKGNVVYPWDQVSNLPSGIMNLPEGNVQNILTVNQTGYMFAGNQGNIYITDGSLASLALNIPDYVAGIPGSPGTYIEPQYYWGDSMYLRGRVYFSLYDQTATKAGNAGGVWSFVPTQNFYLGQDIGLAPRLEAINSYNTYDGYANLLIPNQLQNSLEPLYFSAWTSDVNTPTYGIDNSTSGTNASYVTVIETDAIPVGTMLDKTTFSQLEYKLGAPLDSGATITAKYRTDITSAWTSCNPFITETNRLSGYAMPNFELSQWLQFQFTLTPITSTADTNTFIRFREIRLRQ